VTATALQDEDHVHDARQPDFRELMEHIEEAVTDYKRREESVENIRQVLTNARQEESECLQRSLLDSDPKLIDRIARSRVQIEVNSRRLTVAEESLAGGLESIAELVRQLQARLIQQLSDLMAQRTRTHYEAITQELDLDAVDTFCCRSGYPRDILWRLAAISADVLALEPLHPNLTWIGGLRNLALTLEKLEGDVEQLFKFCRAFETEVGSVPGTSAVIPEPGKQLVES
jgi:hypothetical protein